MIYVLDENMCIVDKKLPDNTINAKDLYIKNGIEIKGVPDDRLLALCDPIHVIVTKDMGLVLRANRRNQNIVFAEGVNGQHWYVVPNSIKIRSRTKLKKCIENKSLIEIDRKKNNLL